MGGSLRVLEGLHSSTQHTLGTFFPQKEEHLVKEGSSFNQ